MIGNLLAKIADGEKLDPIERQQLIDYGNSAELTQSLVSSYVPPGMGEIKLPLPMNLIGVFSPYENVATVSIDIPPDYNHLLIIGSGRVTGAGVNAVYTFCQFNDDSGSNYSDDLLYQIGTTHGSSETLSLTGALIGYLTGDTGSANYNGSFTCWVPHYNSSYYKTMLTLDGIHNGASTSVAIWQSVWKDTSPIKKIVVYPDTTYPSALIEAGTLFSVYGIK